MKKKKNGTSPLVPLPSGEGQEQNRILNRARKTRALDKDPHPSAGSGQALRSSPLRGEGKEQNGNGILDRARKKRAAKGPSPSSSPLQGEGKRGQGKRGEGKIGQAKIGEETENKSGRVAIDPIPYKTWKIKRLPPDLKEELDRMLTEGTLHSCRQLAKWLGDNGFEISHAAIHKYGQKFERKLEAIRLATEQARIVCENFKNDDAQMQDALLRMVQTELFQVLSAVHRKESRGAASVAPVNLGALARCVSNLAKTETELRKRAEIVRAGVATAKVKIDEARTKGLSKDAAAQIKAVLLEI
jgi:Protein of unknown function (DUF3486)